MNRHMIKLEIHLDKFVDIRRLLQYKGIGSCLSCNVADIVEMNHSSR